MSKAPIRTSAAFLIRSDAWPAMLLRIVLLALVAMLVVNWSVERVWSNPSLEREFPRTDFSRRTVALDEIMSGGPPRDSIPAIDRPRFIAPDRAGWLHPDEPVIVVRVGDDARAYPIQIMIWHEIVDRETGSVWNLVGQARSGPLAGRQLNAVPGGVHFAFAWLAFRPESEIFDG